MVPSRPVLRQVAAITRSRSCLIGDDESTTTTTVVVEVVLERAGGTPRKQGGGLSGRQSVRRVSARGHAFPRPDTIRRNQR